MELFTVIEPTAAETPVLVEVPHAGTWVPAPYMGSLVAPVRALGRDADLYVDELYADAPSVGATLLVARTSRYLLDLNRSEDDWDDAAVETRVGSSPPRLSGSMPRGLVWRLTTDSELALARPLTRAELDERIQRLHRPYHQTLQSILERKREKFGFAVVVAAHSMPSRGGRNEVRADVVPGTQGRTTAASWFIEAVEHRALAAGLTLRHDEPYKGGFTTKHYGRPRSGVHAVQIELSRGLYMDEASLLKSSRFAEIKGFCRDLVAAVGQVSPARSA